MYGKSRKGARSYRGSASRNYRKPYSRMLKTAPYTGRRGTYKTGLKFATVGYARNIERKYYDKTYAGLSGEALTGYNSSLDLQGAMWISTQWQNYSFGDSGGPGGGQTISNDMLKTPGNGTSATERIGNKINVKYIKGAFTFTAAVLGNGSTVPPSQGGESLAGVTASIQPYLRTSIRMAIVKDMQVNSTDAQIVWNDVFAGATELGTSIAGIHSELKISNMGRFVVLEDKTFTVDSNNPQKTVEFFINGGKVGHVRYNSTGTSALTDKGVYIIWAAHVQGFDRALTNANVKMGGPIGHSRLCFTDE